MQNASQHCPWFHNISKRQFPIKPDMFPHGSQERFCYCPWCLLEVSGFHHTSTNVTLGKNTCIYWIGGKVGKTAYLDTLEKRNIPCPYQYLILWQTNQVHFHNWLCYPSSYNNLWIFKYQLHEFSIILHNGSNLVPLKTDMNHYTSTYH